MTTENQETEEDLKTVEPAEDEHDPIEGHDDEDEKTAKVDEELDSAETDEDREAIRARRKTERKSRAQRNRERVEALERNLQAITEQNRVLQQQVSSIQDVNAGSQLAQVDSAITQANALENTHVGIHSSLIERLVFVAGATAAVHVVHHKFATAQDATLCAHFVS